MITIDTETTGSIDTLCTTITPPIIQPVRQYRLLTDEEKRDRKHKRIWGDIERLIEGEWVKGQSGCFMECNYRTLLTPEELAALP